MYLRGIYLHTGPKTCLQEHDIECSDKKPCCKGLTCHKYRTNLASQCWKESSGNE